jgi:hypothetical protein
VRPASVRRSAKPILKESVTSDEVLGEWRGKSCFVVGLYFWFWSKEQKSSNFELVCSLDWPRKCASTYAHTA